MAADLSKEESERKINVLMQIYEAASQESKEMEQEYIDSIKTKGWRRSHYLFLKRHHAFMRLQDARIALSNCRLFHMKKFREIFGYH